MAEIQPFTDGTHTAQFSAGATIGRFRVGERLGKGGMGEVYRADDTKLKRVVALKRLAPDLRNDFLYRRRFLQEAERASRFTDSHVAALYDVLEEQGEIFLVMEYVEGENLRQRMRRPIKLQEFFEIAMQCAEALAAAHALNIVHCDIKPENIMLTTGGQVKILDFGVAKHLPRSDQSSTVDRAGTMAGTPAYMAPEVLMERIPDGRADVFSLGVVFYEMLTGHHPFLASSFVATTDRIRNETPAPVRIFNPDVPEGLEAIVRKALAKAPGQRYASAQELLQDLRLVQAGLTPTKLQPYLPTHDASKRTRWIVASVALVVLAVVGFLFYRATHTRPILAERGWVLVTDLETRSDDPDPVPDAGVREGLTIALQQSHYVNVFPRERVYDVLERMKRPKVTRIDENLGREICQRENLQVLITGSIEHVGRVFQITVRAIDPVHGNLLFAEKERFDQKDQFLEKADDLAKKTRENLGESLTRIKETSRPLAKVTTSSLEALQLYSQAKDAMHQGQLDRALAPLQGALQLDPDFAMAHLRLADYYGSIVGKNEKVIEEMKRAYDLRQGVTDRERLWIEANYFTGQERYEEAVQSLGILVNLYPDDVDFHLALADAYDNVARPEKTVLELREVLRLDPQSASAYSRLLFFLTRTNSNEEALALGEQARQHHIDTPNVHAGLGLAYLGLGNLERARQEFQAVQKSGQPFEDLGEFYLAKTDIYEGKFASAQQHLQSIIQRDQAAHTKGLQLASRWLLGRIDLLLGHAQLAQSEAEHILAASAEDLQIVDIVSAGILYARCGAEGGARRALDRLQGLSDSAPTAWTKRSVLALRGEIALAQNLPDQAISAFLAAEQAYPQAPTHVAMALAYQAKRDWGQAGEQWQHVLKARGEMLQEEFPGDLVLAHLQLARVEVQQGDIAAARQEYEKFLRLWNNSEDSSQRRKAQNELQALKTN